GRVLTARLEGSTAAWGRGGAGRGVAAGPTDTLPLGGRGELSQAAPSAPYSGGFALDPGPPRYETNVAGLTAAEAIHPRRLPKDLVAMTQAMGRMSDATNESESENARWWMTAAESTPFNADTDAAIPIGTVIPGVIMLEKRDKENNEIIGFGRWAAGRW